MNNVEITLTISEIHFLMDLMMVYPLGHPKDHAPTHDVDDSALYNHLENCLPNAHSTP